MLIYRWPPKISNDKRIAKGPRQGCKPVHLCRGGREDIQGSCSYLRQGSHHLSCCSRIQLLGAHFANALPPRSSRPTHPGHLFINANNTPRPSLSFTSIRYGSHAYKFHFHLVQFLQTVPVLYDMDMCWV